MSNSEKTINATYITAEKKTEQKEQLDKVLKKEQSQGSALRALKRYSEEYSDIFTLSEFQEKILSNQDEYFHCIKASYTKSQRDKVKQIKLLKKLENGEEVDLITRETFGVYYYPNVMDDEFKVHQVTVGSKEKAEKFVKKVGLKNIEIEKNISPISTGFTPKEMLNRLHTLETKFFAMFSNPKAVTPAMVKRAIGEEVTETDKKLSVDGEAKEELKKAS